MFMKQWGQHKRLLVILPSTSQNFSCTQWAMEAALKMIILKRNTNIYKQIKHSILEKEMATHSSILA